MVIPAHLVKESKGVLASRVTPPPTREFEKKSAASLSGTGARKAHSSSGAAHAPAQSAAQVTAQATVAPPAIEPDMPIRTPIRVVAPERRTPVTEGAVLVTTTEHIEGRTISTYFGLINANAVIEVDNDVSCPPGDEPLSTDALYRKHFKNATLLVLRDLRREAAALGANAVIAVLFNFQKMEGGLLPTLLLSAVGTAVHVEGLK